MWRLAIRALFVVDWVRFVLFRERWRHRLKLDPPTSPNLRLAELRIDPGGSVEIGARFATERQHGNKIWVQAGARLRLGEDTWLRTEYGTNRITLFPGAQIDIGPRALLNGAMVHAKRAISIGSDVRLGFGVRVLDADLHPLDSVSPEQIDPVRIGDRVWIGADAMVLRGVSIGDDTVVGAGSVVTKDLPPRVLAVGAPARPVREIASREGCA